MPILKREVMPVSTESDVVLARQTVRRWTTEAGFSLVDQTKMVTAASEIARNTVIYGGGGSLTLELSQEGLRRVLRLTFEDKGPGIPDLQKAMTDGYTTGSGLGLGLSGSKRLVNEFDIQSRPGEGTRVVLARWK
jgi:serine/threonine-protein kinase RsbT